MWEKREEVIEGRSRVAATGAGNKFGKGHRQKVEEPIRLDKLKMDTSKKRTSDSILRRDLFRLVRDCLSAKTSPTRGRGDLVSLKLCC